MMFAESSPRSRENHSSLVDFDAPDPTIAAAPLVRQTDGGGNTARAYPLSIRFARGIFTPPLPPDVHRLSIAMVQAEARPGRGGSAEAGFV
jgi:hypothetical protein